MDQNLLAFLLDTRPGFTVRKAQELDTFLSEFKAWEAARLLATLTAQEAAFLDEGKFVAAVKAYKVRADVDLKTGRNHVVACIKKSPKWTQMFPYYARVNV